MKRSIIYLIILLLLMSLTLNTAFAQGPKTSLDQAVVNGDIDRVKSEIAAGVDINKKNRMGWTLLHIAINKKHTEIAKLLIDKGADVNIKDNRGKTPVILAVETGQKDIVEALIAKKADLNAMDAKADNALSLAKKNKQTEITELLLKNGAKEPDLSLLQSERMYSLPGTQPGANYNQRLPGSYQARSGRITAGQSEQPNLLADPNEIKSRVKTFKGLEKEIAEVSAKSNNEEHQWLQMRYDNRTTLARYVDKQFEDEINFIKKVAVEESAKKTVAAIEDLRTNRRKRSLKINRELNTQKREQRQIASANTRGRGRTTGRGTRGRAYAGADAAGTNTNDNMYGRGAINMQRGAQFETVERSTEPIDPQTEQQMEMWLQTTPDKKLELIKELHPQIQAEIGSIRNIAVEEKAKKTTAAIDGVLLARKERFDGFVIKIEEEQRKQQEAQARRNRAAEPGQAYQQDNRYGGQMSRRGTGTNAQQQSTRRGRRR